MILRTKKAQSRLGMSSTLLFACCALIVLPLSTAVRSQDDMLNPLRSGLGRSTTGEGATEGLDEIPDGLSPIDVTISIPVSGATDAAADDSVSKANSSLEDRVRRLEALVERLVGALESRDLRRGLTTTRRAAGAAGRTRTPGTPQPTIRRRAAGAAAPSGIPAPDSVEPNLGPSGVKQALIDRRHSPIRPKSNVTVSDSASGRSSTRLRGFSSRRPVVAETWPTFPGSSDSMNVTPQILNQLESIDRQVEKLNRDRQILLEMLKKINANATTPTERATRPKVIPPVSLRNLAKTPVSRSGINRPSNDEPVVPADSVLDDAFDDDSEDSTDKATDASDNAFGFRATGASSGRADASDDPTS